ncbi:exopolyphosphatase [Vibrio sp. SCSIO 43137]|uniref:exopolyphosphatase n=1 Tax=Vibrio sp. SCSIO 43137 TaxID=3021011 RepID=UPI0023075CA5|nr:exopolyphosphatase [Vibrio sp. SCSIO 43137]WCE30265.1 exopolyphosphatase [Vibrio sp. SCSIO 43137]
MNEKIGLESRKIAAIDLGSNSFHMVVANVVGEDLHIVSRHKQRVRLASGLDKSRILSEEAIQRGLDCLAMFAERLQGFEPGDVRIAATHTLRQARNAIFFIRRAREILPFPVEIIPGTEEARLIYLGVAHTQPESESKLVIDIGGGSTEIIIGDGFDAELVNSTLMGCVSFTERYFPNGELSRENFARAEIASQQQFESLIQSYKRKGWQLALGSSGTIKAVREALVGMGYEDGIITAKRMAKLIELICQADNLADLKLEGLNDERKPVFPAGVAILDALIKGLDIREMHFSDGALREGLLYEMEERFERTDIRMRTTENLARKHLVDLSHADKVRKQASGFLKQLITDKEFKNNEELTSLLGWSALLHEVGLSISYQGCHRHAAYILRYTNMPGFNAEQQLVLSTLVRFHRKSLKLQEMEEFTQFKKKHVIQLIRILRLSVLLNGQRNDDPLPELKLRVKQEDHWKLICKEADWLENNKLLQADLETECEFWKKAGWKLEF